MIMSARKVDLGVKIACPHCGFTTRYDASFLEDAISEHREIFCVACDKSFKIFLECQTRAAEQRNGAVAGEQTCPSCDGVGAVHNGSDFIQVCARCKGTGHV